MEKSWEQVREILAQATRVPPQAIAVEALQTRWERAKVDLIPLFPEDGRISWELPERVLTPEDLRVAYEEASKLCTSLVAKPRFAEFSEDEGRAVLALLQRFLAPFSPAELASNRVSAKTVENMKPKMTLNIPLQEGMKLSKLVLKALNIRAHDSEVWKASLSRYFPRGKPQGYRFNKQNSEALVELSGILLSRIIEVLQGFKKDVVTVSINPVDFLLASAHTTGWRSCYNIANGEYKTAVMALMDDSSTVIAYAHRREAPCVLDPRGGSAPLENVVLPVKLWRQWVHVDLQHRSALFGREFPSEMPEYAKAARRIVARALADFTGADDSWYVRKYRGADPLCSEDGEEKDQSDTSGYVFETDEAWVYPDDAPTARIVLKDGGKFPMIRLDGWPICPLCGESRFEEESTGTLVCEDCREQRVSCAICSTFRSLEEMHWVETADVYVCHSCEESLVLCAGCGCELLPTGAAHLAEQHYCPDCFRELFVVCTSCGQIVPKQEAVFLHPRYHEGHGKVICSRCQAESQENFSRCTVCGWDVFEQDMDGDSCRFCAQHQPSTSDITIPWARSSSSA